MTKMTSYRPKIGTVQYDLKPSHIVHLCLLFIERMPANSIDLDHPSHTMVRDMCWVMLDKFGQSALTQDLKPKMILRRQELMTVFDTLIEAAPMWDPTIERRTEERNGTNNLHLRGVLVRNPRSHVKV